MEENHISGSCSVGQERVGTDWTGRSIGKLSKRTVMLYMLTGVSVITVLFICQNSSDVHLRHTVFKFYLKRKMSSKYWGTYADICNLTWNT